MLTFNAITHTCNMGRNQTKTCNVCFKSMRGDVLKRHMKKHERGNDDNIITKGLDDGKTEDIILTKELNDGKKGDNIVTKELADEKTENNIVSNGEHIRYTDEKFIAVKKRVFAELEEFDRKMELGRYVKLVVDKHGVNENGLGNDTKEALKTYELHGKNKEEEDIYKCTYCGNWKADSVLKCIYCGNLSFEKTNVK